MALSGGSADKVGNEYETWWTLRRVTQLLRGDVDAMAIEPIGADGAELWVEVDGMRTYDQVKYRSSGSWTIGRLRQDGLLAKLTRHYAAGWHVRLVLSQPADELEGLIVRARASSSGDELWASVSDPTSLDLIREEWGVGRDETRTFLLNTTVRHDGLPHLKEFVELVVEMLVIGSVDLALGVLRRFIEDGINCTFAAPDVWRVLEASGLARRPRIAHGPASAKLQDTFQRYVRSIERSVPTGGVISRREVGDIVNAVRASGSAIVLVAGKAGSGKSVVLAEAVRQLAQAGMHVAAIRLDRVSPAASTAAQLGVGVDLDGSPTVMLSEVSSASGAGVLVIDQLDAVSSYSGRMPDVYDAVDDALHQARLLGNVRVVLAVRSVDLQEDPRLRKIAGENAPIVEVGELDAEDIRAYLTRIGTDIGDVDATTLELLRLPIHLYVFSELDPPMRSAQYRTLNSLYGAFTKSFRKRLDLAGYGDEWPVVAAVLVERMNADEALAVPEDALQQIRELYVAALVSANVLVEQGGRISLFHETYFDYLFAKSFQPRGQALVHWFSMTGQGLFRRSQLRQLLAYIAGEERDAFIAQVIAVAESSLRPHLVSIAYSVLEGLTPRPSDWMALQRLITAGNPFASRVVALVGGPNWFAAADATGGIERLLSDPDWSEMTASLVARLSSDLPARVLQILAPRLSDGEIWVQALRTAVEIGDSPELAAFVLDQVEGGGLDLPGRPFDVLGTPLFYNLITTHPEDALRLLSASLRREIDRTTEDGNPDLEHVFSGRRRHSIDPGKLDQLASALPEDFVEAILPIVEVIALGGSADARRPWGYRVVSSHRDFGEELYFALDNALTELTHNDLPRAMSALEHLSRHKANALDFLVCRALLQAPADYAVDWILESEDHLAVGWLSDPRWESRRLVEHAAATCSDRRLAALESFLLFWVPEFERPAHQLRWRGWTELQFLSALPAERLSPLARRRLAELRRKFPQYRPVEPAGISGGAVGSPIRRVAAQRMTDAHWLGAIGKYATRPDHTTFRGGEAFGGTDELAGLMGALAKESPTRFLEFALALPPSAPATYTDHIIRNIAGEVDQLYLLPLLLKFRADHPTESGRAIAAAIDPYAQEISDELLQQLLLLSRDPDPDREFARERANNDYYYGGDLVTAGINSTRGQVAGTLARVLFADSGRLEESLPALRRLANDRIAAVRAVAAEPALAYASIDRVGGLDLMEILFNDDRVLATSTALRALRWTMVWDAERFAPFLIRALASEDAKEAGAVWANCAVNDALGSAPKDIASLSTSARLGAAEAISTNPGIAPALLMDLFNDADPGVRSEMSRSLHFLRDMERGDIEDLVAGLLTSDMFAEFSGDLVDGIEELSVELPSLTREVCRRVLDGLEASPPTGYVALTGNLIAVLVRLYRSSEGAQREDALDLIDRTVLLQLWRVEQTLDDAR